MTPQEIAQITQALAEKLGPLAEVVWAAYMRQVYVNIFGGALWMVGFLVAAFACWQLAHKCQEIKGSTDREFVMAFAYGGTVLCLILAFCALTFDVLKILNPQYHAIEMLLGR